MHLIIFEKRPIHLECYDTKLLAVLRTASLLYCVYEAFQLFKVLLCTLSLRSLFFQQNML